MLGTLGITGISPHLSVQWTAWHEDEVFLLRILSLTFIAVLSDCDDDGYAFYTGYISEETGSPDGNGPSYIS